MKHLTLKRITENIFGTPGVLYDDNFLCTTMERRWEHNAANESCIPAGDYVCKRVHSSKFGETFEVTGVKDRTAILFHKGNYAFADSHGCILLGVGYLFMNNQWAITDSGIAFRNFLHYMAQDNEFALTIKNT